MFIVLDSDVTDATFPTSADADVRLLTSADADADLHNPKQNACVTIEFSKIQFLIFMKYIQEGLKPGKVFNLPRNIQKLYWHIKIQVYKTKKIKQRKKMHRAV